MEISMNFRIYLNLLSLEKELKLDEPPEDLYLLCPDLCPADPMLSKDFKSLECIYGGTDSIFNCC